MPTLIEVDGTAEGQLAGMVGCRIREPDQGVKEGGREELVGSAGAGLD